MENLKSNNLYIHYVLILIVCFFAFFVNNQVIPADLMEARNLATAQEMVHTGNYLVPTMNGELRLEKPPLPTWIAAGVELILPGNLVAQRCVAGAVATLMVFFLYIFVSRLSKNGNLALFSALVLATCFNVLLMGRTATWDIYCHSFMLGAIYFLFFAFMERGAQWGKFLLAGLFLGLSFLSKGPVSFYALLLPFLISFIVVYRPRMKGKVVPLVVMLLICLVISAWWTVYIYIFHQDMALSIAQKETGSWLSHNVRPWYYYWQFPAEAGIWALFLITAIGYFFACKKREFRKEYRFAIIWFLASLVLLSVIPEKKTRYLLPILIPGAQLIGFYFYYGMQSAMSAGEKVLFRINAVVISIILITIPIVLYLMFYQEGQLSFVVLALSILFSWGLACLILTSSYGKGGIQVNNVFTAIILSMMMVESFCLLPIGRMFINEERHSIRILRENKTIQGLPFYYPQGEPIRMELVYEANQIIRPLDVTDTLLVQRSLPFVFVSSLSVDSVFAGQHVLVQPIDRTDNNWRKSEHKRYNLDLVKEIAIIKKK